MLPEVFTVGLGYNLAVAITAYIMYRIMLRLFNRFNGISVPRFIRECREKHDYYPIAFVLAAQSISAALLFGLVIS